MVVILSFPSYFLVTLFVFSIYFCFLIWCLSDIIINVTHIQLKVGSFSVPKTLTYFLHLELLHDWWSKDIYIYSCILYLHVQLSFSNFICNVYKIFLFDDYRCKIKVKGTHVLSTYINTSRTVQNYVYTLRIVSVVHFTP